MEKILFLRVKSFTVGFSIANLLTIFINSTIREIVSIVAFIACIWAYWKC